MNERMRRRYWWPLAVVAILAIVAGIVVVRRGPFGVRPAGTSLPGPGSKRYEEMVSAFYSGVAALDSDANQVGKSALDRAIELVPEEPAAWANRGLLRIRLGDLDAAERDLEKAREMAPESGEIERLLGLLESRRGRFAEAIDHLRRAIERNPGDLRSRFALGQELERRGAEGGTAEALAQMGEILKSDPENLSVLLERARLAAKGGDDEALGNTVTRLGELAPTWPPKVQSQYETLKQAAAGKNPRLVATRVIVLRNLLMTVPAFRESIDAVQVPVGMVGEPIEHFLRLASPSPTASPPDTGMSYAIKPEAGDGPARWDALVALPRGKAGSTSLFVVDGRVMRPADGSDGKVPSPAIDGPPPGNGGLVDLSKVKIPFPGGPKAIPPSPAGVALADWNSDYLMDFVLAGAGGVRVFRQNEDGSFVDVTEASGLPPEVRGADAFGVWAADLELDGDLDFVIAARAGPPLVLRNQGDGTFGVMRPFEGSTDLRDFGWADFDRDGTPDAGLLDARGELQVYNNERAGRFRRRELPKDLGKIAAITVADANSDGGIDLLAYQSDGVILRLSDRDEGRAWDRVEMTPKTGGKIKGDPRLFAADLDNNGSLDLIATDETGTALWLSDETGRFHRLRSAAPMDFRVFAIEDSYGSGRLDLLGLSDAGRAVRAIRRGTKSYHWQVVRPRAAKVEGDGRINSFGLGGEVEVRSGLLVQKQVIAGPAVHFGLGDRLSSDVTRVVWPNGTVQAEFNTKADQVLVAEQRLKGSCPFVYAYDGRAMSFVTDFLWRSPLGLRINAQDTAGAGQTTDWVKIRGDQLVPRDGHYDIRLTAELWETHYWDHVSLMVVDHPEDTEVFVDERFARQSPPLTVHTTGPLHPVARARDDKGRDVTDVVRTRDGRYLDTFGRGFYQGVTRDHWVEVEIGEDVPADRRIFLVAQGWIHPTDSSINVALGQGRHSPPRGLVLEVPTSDGRWVVARDDLGFPAGKNKTILIDLDGVFRPGAPRHLRLRTNLEIFWDALAVATVEDGATLRTERIAPATAELRPRGYSLMTRADDSSPELPHYETLTGTAQRWNDLIGDYTRFGEVRELLEKVDDRYVIVNAGDEVAFRFPAPASPRAGWVRDFVLIGDGWNKDGDYNTAFSRTVLPLPSHDRPSYDTPPGDLEDDPVYRRYAKDWEEYHTRYITPRVFRDGLRPHPATTPRRDGE